MPDRISHQPKIQSAKDSGHYLDIYRSARLPIEKHGGEAPIHAAMRANEIL